MGEDKRFKKTKTNRQTDKKKNKKSCVTEFGDQGTLKTPFSVFCLQRFYTLAHNGL